MRKINIYSYGFSLLVIICLCSNVLKAQQPASRMVPDSAATTKISISKARATQLQWAFNFHNAEINKLMKDNTMDAKERQQLLKQLLDQRRQVVAAILTPVQKEQLKQSMPVDSVKAQARRDAIILRHQQQLNRTPHQESQFIPTEVLKKSKSPSVNQQ